jgi:hypothetical protein
MDGDLLVSPCEFTSIREGIGIGSDTVGSIGSGLPVGIGIGIGTGIAFDCLDPGLDPEGASKGVNLSPRGVPFGETGRELPFRVNGNVPLRSGLSAVGI